MTNKKKRPFPRHSLEEALQIGQKIQDERGGLQFKKLLLADALGIKPSSSEFRDLLSSSYKYGLTEGTEKASDVFLTPLGKQATQSKDSVARLNALKKVILDTAPFGKFFEDYLEKKLPSPEMLAKILVAEYDIPSEYAEECGDLVISNGQFVSFIREIGGSPHVLLDLPFKEEKASDEEGQKKPKGQEESQEQLDVSAQAKSESQAPRAIFIGHGKNKAPLMQLQKILSTFQIPHRVVAQEANLGRPIPIKVKEVMQQCGSAILIFTKDEKFFDEDGKEIWRPSENVVHELGASSFLYEDRIVIFKEEGLYFPANYQSIGYIEFGETGLESKTSDLLKELIGFGLVKITTAS